MDNVFLIIPLLFTLIGWALEYWEFLAIAGGLGFYVSFTLILTTSPLTDSAVMLSIVYLVLGIDLMLRTFSELAGMRVNK